MDKKDFLFKFVEPRIRAKIKMDEEALFSVTDQYTADKISNEIRKRIGAQSEQDACSPSTPTPNTPNLPTNSSKQLTSIIDATACVGGNTMSFAKQFQTVHAVELDSTRHYYLKYNMTLLGLHNVVTHHADILQLLAELPKADVLFLDPPWGGPNYKSQERLELYLSGVPLCEVCERIARSGKARYVVLKVPVNFELKTFHERVSPFMTRIPSSTKFRKLLLLMYKISVP